MRSLLQTLKEKIREHKKTPELKPLATPDTPKTKSDIFRRLTDCCKDL